MHIDDLRRELESIAADAPASANDARTVVRRGVRRFWLRRGLAGVIALVVGLGAAVLVGHMHDDHFELSITAGSGQSAPASSGLTAATIADGRWTTIAPFPLEVRSQDAVVWTGSQLIVWGGEIAPKVVVGDGAAYDPDTNTWRVLPPAPISARTMAAAVWTGQEMIIWGGERAYPGGYTNDGAAFDPASWKWRRIAASPLAPRYGAHLLWTGTDAIAVGGSESNSEARSVLDAASYDPASNQWQRIASLPGISGAVIEDVRPVWTGREILAWELWTRTVGHLTTIRTRLVEYDPKTGDWTPGPTDDPYRNVFAPIWTGHEVVAFAEPPLCELPDGAQNCGPPPTNVHGSVFDPATGVWHSMPQGPADEGADAGVWTGGDLVVLSGGANDSATGKMLVAPGSAAAWDPATNTWTALPRAPIGPNVDATLWTGREILLFGTVDDTRTGRVSSRALRYALAPTHRVPAVTTSGYPKTR
jgi:N-acetylneuraminic acid mutarotase